MYNKRSGCDCKMTGPFNGDECGKLAGYMHGCLCPCHVRLVKTGNSPALNCHCKHPSITDLPPCEQCAHNPDGRAGLYGYHCQQYSKHLLACHHRPDIFRFDDRGECLFEPSRIFVRLTAIELIGGEMAESLMSMMTSGVVDISEVTNPIARWKELHKIASSENNDDSKHKDER